MQYEIEFLDDGGPVDVEISLSGELTPTGFREMMETLANAPSFRAGLGLLVDISTLVPLSFPQDEPEVLTAPVLARDWDYPPRAVAIVAPDDEQFQAAITYRAHLGGSISRRHVVRTRAEALAWLEQQPPA